MLFNSYIFVFLFLPMALIGYYTINKTRKYALAEVYLIGMSLWFYGYFNISYLAIIIASILGNFTLATLMHKKEQFKKLLVIVGIAGNIGVLFYYKYMGFFIENINVIFKQDLEVTNILLPLGISFFTFQQLSYIVDSYTGKSPVYNLREYALFVTFFPQLIAGPIVLHNETIPQFRNENKKTFNIENFVQGLMALSLGMGKKVIIADYLGGIVNVGYENVYMLTSIDAVIIMLAYTFQIYFDFSGYCDIATGIGKMFNIDMPMNFNSPYKAVTIVDFWKRWHITLTRFLRTYVYFPLGGNRGGHKYINLLIVFLVSGIWHGANYTFIMWGIFHGLFMVFTKIFQKYIDRLHPALNWLMTFGFVNVTWILFRADSLGQAKTILFKMLKFTPSTVSSFISDGFKSTDILFLINQLPIGQTIADTFVILLVFGFLMILILGTKNTNERLGKPIGVINAIGCALVLFWSIMLFSGISTFLYFNF